MLLRNSHQEIMVTILPGPVLYYFPGLEHLPLVLMPEAAFQGHLLPSTEEMDANEIDVQQQEASIVIQLTDSPVEMSTQ